MSGPMSVSPVAIPLTDAQVKHLSLLVNTKAQYEHGMKAVQSQIEATMNGIVRGQVSPDDPAYANWSLHVHGTTLHFDPPDSPTLLPPFSKKKKG